MRWYDPLLLRVLPPLIAMLVKLLMLSCRVIKVKGKEHERRAFAEGDGKAIYITWHQRMSYHFHYFGSRHVTVMISQSRDGEYVTRIAKWLGFKNVRGSSTRGGAEALREMTERIKNGDIGGMLADGPVGPARVAKLGSVILARDTGCPLIPILWSADRCWILNSWDRYMIPKPFAKIFFYYAEPVWVPSDADRETLEIYRRQVEDSLNKSTSLCDAYFGADRPWRKVKKEG